MYGGPIVNPGAGNACEEELEIPFRSLALMVGG